VAVVQVVTLQADLLAQAAAVLVVQLTEQQAQRTQAAAAAVVTVELEQMVVQA
jgi:hypothetical protein